MLATIACTCMLGLIVSAVFWIRDLGMHEEVYWFRESWPTPLHYRTRAFALSTFDGRLTIGHSRFGLNYEYPDDVRSLGMPGDADDARSKRPPGNSFHHFRRQLKPPMFVPASNRLGFGHHRLESTKPAVSMFEDTYVVPLWLIMLIFAIPPLRWLQLHRRRRILETMGACAVCGYDLRATPDRCPECGTVPAK